MAAIEPSAKISEAKLSPTVSTNTTVVCKVCTCLLQSPGILPCLHHICVDWLCLHIQQSGQIICADCQTIHPMVTASVQVTPPLSLSLLADQPAQCPSCKEEVQLKNSTKHLSSGCTMRKYITVQHILQEELDVPLTKLEERVGSNIVRWWIRQSDTSEIRLPTGGSVMPIYNYTRHFSPIVFWLHVHVHFFRNGVQLVLGCWGNKGQNLCTRTSMLQRTDMWICLTQLKGFDAHCKNNIYDVPHSSVMPNHWPKEERQQGNKNYT
jgi:hypothetical protein